MRLVLISFFALAACSGGDKVDDSGSSAPVCQHAIVSDIDETLTTSDDEWISQLVDPSHDPAMRPMANDMMNAYADLGYRIIYITARSEDVTLGDDTTAREATEAWLLAHDFPHTSDDVILAETLVIGDSARDYKAAAIDEMQADGLQVHWAYGNAVSDIEGFQAAGIPNDLIFYIGDVDDDLGTVNVPNADAYEAHMSSHMTTVQAVDCP